MGRFMRHLQAFVRPRRRARTPEEFQVLFSSFREVMDSNTRAIEVITDMGDVLGGDYLFDIQYVRRSYDELDARVRNSLRHFSDVTAEKHAEVNEAYERIDRVIRQVLEGAAPRTGAEVLPLAKCDGSMAAIVGGKMANLGEAERGLPLSVPDGFVVTTRAFDAYMQHNRVFEKAGPPQDRRQSPLTWYEGLAEVILHGVMPPHLQQALARALRKLPCHGRQNCTLAVRSSAGDEDGEHSFAGQFTTVLGVLPDITAVEKAYRKVIASLYSGQAAAYQQRFGYDPVKMKMAVGFLVMVDAAASGVLYTADPAGRSDAMVVSSSWGLGTSVVGGAVDADQFEVARDGGVITERIGDKETMSVRRPGGGVEEMATPAERRSQSSVTPRQIAELARAGTLLESHFRGPQDVEWAFDADGRLFILQSRPLMLAAQAEGPAAARVDRTAGRITFKNAGLVVQRGVATGIVHVVKNDHDLDDVPRGAILAVRHDSPSLVRVMPRISAIIADSGSLTSHLASIAREFRMPTVVNTGDATKVLMPQRDLTVVLTEVALVLPGRNAGAFAAASKQTVKMDDLYEFRRKRYLLRHIAPLNLVDPFRDEFSPKACRTVHDILRFIHEKAVGRLVEAAGFGTGSSRAVKLDLPVPAGITVIDIGGGLRNSSPAGPVVPGQVASAPFQAVIRGMIEPGAWRTDAVPLTVNDFFTSMFRAPDLIAEGERQTGANVAVISRDYLNLNIKFGYHYTIIDSYVSGTPRSNHLYFRFAGGATDLTKRSRRLQVIASILEEQGFALGTKGDMIIARISNLSAEDMLARLEVIGRLISYTRQLDAVLKDSGAVERAVASFSNGPGEKASGQRCEIQGNCDAGSHR